MSPQDPLEPSLGPVLENPGPRPLPEPSALIGEHCRILPLDVQRDAASLYEALCGDGRDALWAYMADGPFPSFEAYQAYLTRIAGRPDPLFVSILERDSGRALGCASYLRIEPAHGCIEVGSISYGAQLQRSTAATEAMYLMMRYAFSLGYRRYEWKCNARNRPSRRAAQRLGFSYEGTFSQHMIVKGRNRDTSWYAVLDHEWPALQQAFMHWLDAGNFDGAGRQRCSLRTLTRPLLRAVDPSLPNASY